MTEAGEVRPVEHIAVSGYLRIVRAGIIGDELARNLERYVNAWGDQEERSLIYQLAMDLEEWRGEGEDRRADVTVSMILALATGIMRRYWEEERCLLEAS